MSEWKGNREQRHGHLSWAQHGDDMMIANIFDLIGIRKGRYLDLGAHHPEDISNTALLYSLGWSGVNVEANPNLIKAFQSKRGRDITVNAGVGPKRGVMPFLMYDDTNGRNTFCYNETQTDLRHTIKQEIKVSVVTLNDIIGRYFENQWPDFINMDLEGWDYEVLATTLFPSGLGPRLPAVFCIEIRQDDGERFKNLMKDIGYFCLCRMGENLIFVLDRYEGQVR